MYPPPFSFEPPVRLYNGLSGSCRMGAFSYSVGRIANIEMGRYCSVAHGVEVLADHPTGYLTSSPVAYETMFPQPWAEPVKNPNSFESNKPIQLGHDVWVGAGVKFRGGITVGTGAIVAAGAVVTKNVEPYAIVGGVPAKRIRWRFKKVLREQLLASEWWRYNLSGLDLDFTNPEKALSQLQKMIDEGLQPYKPQWVEVKN